MAVTYHELFSFPPLVLTYTFLSGNRKSTNCGQIENKLSKTQYDRLPTWHHNLGSRGYGLDDMPRSTKVFLSEHNIEGGLRLLNITEGERMPHLTEALFSKVEIIFWNKEILMVSRERTAQPERTNIWKS